MRIQAFSRRLQSFARAQSGSIGLWMGVAILPITLMVGAATDLRRVETMRGAVQDASDAAVLAAAKAYLAAGSADGGRLDAARAAAGATLGGNLREDGERLTALGWTVAEQGGELVLTTTAKVPLAFGGLFGMDALPVKTSAASVIDIRLEVALVLDTTGSMAINDRIGTLKQATGALIDQLAAAAQQSRRANPLKIALVPYSNTVRVATSHQGAEWLDSYSNGDRYWVAKPANLVDRFNSYGPAGWGGCLESRPMPFDVQDTAATKSDPNSLFVPFFNTETPTTDPNKDCGLSEIVPLTGDTAKVKAAALAMKIDGYTNIPMGLMWGWHALTPDAGPFGANNAEPYSHADLVKAVVLMTDGQNNLGFASNEYHGTGRMDQNRVGADENSTLLQRRAALDARLVALCKNMKARGIVIYSVRVEETEGPDTVMRGCASTIKGQQKFWDVADAKDLPAVFDKIGQDLIEVRLSR